MTQINLNDTNAARIASMTDSRHAHLPPDLKLVAKIGLSVAVASCLGLLLVLVLIGVDRVRGYAPIIGAFGLARHSLGQAMWVFGLAITSFAGIAAWGFSLYTSFRVAGPLYRISRNLQLQIEHGTARLVPIRADDSLQQQWKDFEASVAVLHAQHEELRRAVIDVEQALETNTAAASAATTVAAITRLHNAEKNVRL